MLNTSINGEPPPRNGSRTVRFGAFEADLHSGEVRKSGNRVKLQDQPFKVLQILLERPGDLVSREELQTRIWPEETYGDFDHAVNVAVGQAAHGAWRFRRQSILYRDGAPPWLSLCCPARARPDRGGSAASPREIVVPLSRFHPGGASWRWPPCWFSSWVEFCWDWEPGWDAAPLPRGRWTFSV